MTKFKFELEPIENISLFRSVAFSYFYTLLPSPKCHFLRHLSLSRAVFFCIDTCTLVIFFMCGIL